MGDLCDRADLNRFMHSPEGTRLRLVIHELLTGKSIVNVTFTNDVHSMGIELILSDGTRFHCVRPELDVDALRSRYVRVFEPPGKNRAAK